MSDPETCQAARYDENGEAVFECQRTDYEVVSVHDDEVRLCPAHRSWAAAMGLSS